MGSYETLSGGMVAAGAGLFAGWLAWSAVQIQIAAEAKRAAADKVEVEAVLQEDLDCVAEGLGAIWKILEEFDEVSGDSPGNRTKLEGVIYGIEEIANDSWLSTSRKMVSLLGWQRRRRYEQLFQELELLQQFRSVVEFDVLSALDVVRNIANYLVSLRPETDEYFQGRFWRVGKGWTLGHAIEVRAGVADNG